MGRRRRELRALLGARDESRALPVRSRPTSTLESLCVPLTERTDGVFHGYLPDARPGQLYGYRVYGPWDPARGHRFNPAKVVLDPYASLIARTVRWDPSLFAFDAGTDGDGPADAVRQRAVRAARGGARPGLRLGRRSATRACPGPTRSSTSCTSRASRRNTSTSRRRCAARISASRRRRRSRTCKRLGVTAVELMPIHAHADEWQLAERGLTNYWGYNTLAYFAPDPRFVASASLLEAAREFKTMVRALHAAGLEVILDVVYNHTAEGDHLGPTLSMRGIDNAVYYRRARASPSRYEDFTGCGNTLDTRSPRVIQLILDSLRYWVVDMHVDGFRFDLATALARESPGFDRGAGVLRRRAAGSDPLAREADRRALGSRRGRLPGRQLPRGLERMERPIPRRGAPVLARRRRDAAGNGDTAVRQQRCVRPRRPAAARERQLRHVARRLHARGPRRLRAETQRGQRRRQPRRRLEQPQLELRRRGPDDGSGDPRDPRSPAPQFSAHAVRVDRRADAERRRRSRPHAARQQQRVQPGLRRWRGRRGSWAIATRRSRRSCAP